MTSRKRSKDIKSDDSSLEESYESDESGVQERSRRSNSSVPSKSSRQDRRRESNRLSKRKCRKQRKEMVSNMEDQIRRLTQEQKDLKAENDDLRKELLDNVLNLPKQPEDPARNSGELPFFLENRLPHQVATLSPNLGMMITSPRNEGRQDIGLSSRDLNVARANSYQGTEGLVPAVTMARNHPASGNPIASVHLLDMISMLANSQAQTQDPSISFVYPITQAAGHLPAANHLIAAAQNVLPYMSYENSCHDTGMAWLSSSHSIDNLGSLLNHHAASHLPLNPNDLLAGPNCSGSPRFHPPQCQQHDSLDQKRPARK